ncbi:MAG TPA: DUF6587 family protein [Steroidobacteraceae bacterium]|nr:DUF6587 family protein [Steroidobacteraceae bacterium]
MDGLLDKFLVGAALLASAIHALLSLGPRTWKHSVLIRAAASIRSIAATPGLRRVSRRLEAAAGKPSGACGGCEGCGRRLKSR